MAQPIILTVQEVAAYLRLHAVTVYRMAQSGDLPAFRVGRRWRFRREQIEQWMADHQAAGAATGSQADGAGRARPDRPRSGRR
ncbi:MAG: helix-turn-helix domain-containing protein [Armatimonadota bacterium]